MSQLQHSQFERGQAATILILCLGVVLIGALGFSVGYSNLWFHRQWAQAEAIRLA